MTPLEEYRTRRENRRAQAARIARADDAIVWARLVVFVSAGVLGWLVFVSKASSPAWLLVPAALFALLVVLHDRVITARQRRERAVKLYDDGIARIEDRAPPGDGRSRRFGDEQHPYAADLDLFGRGSLFERLSTARTSMGEATLAAWLKAPAATAVIRRRQAAVAELAGRLDLKEELAIMGADVAADVDATNLATWAVSPAPEAPIAPLGFGGARVVTALLGAVIATTMVVWMSGRSSVWPFVSAALLGVGWTVRLRPLVRWVVASAERRTGELELLALLLARLEREAFASPLLVELRNALDAGLPAGTGKASRTAPPSVRIAQLARRVAMLEARRNQIVAIITAPLLWTAQWALAVEAWRRTFGASVAQWLSAVGEIEALVSFSTFAYENPALPFPTIVERRAGGGEVVPVFEGDGLVHPLLPVARRVPNDLAMGGGRARLMVVSGSNMSGKSTLLRTVGVNAVLALAGGPVCAARLALSPVAIGATLRINDSLQEGRSRFFAEITRLRQIVELANGPLPVLFLLDEILSGTNSHDRRVGAAAVLRTLLERNALGLATTHDLALTALGDELGDGLKSAATNVHFADELHGGEMVFDYRMRPGVVKKSNALALMRAIGLDVSVGDRAAGA